jgi:hypothetical protein
MVLRGHPVRSHSIPTLLPSEVQPVCFGRGTGAESGVRVGAAESHDSLQLKESLLPLRLLLGRGQLRVRETELLNSLLPSPDPHFMDHYRAN